MLEMAILNRDHFPVHAISPAMFLGLVDIPALMRPEWE